MIPTRAVEVFHHALPTYGIQNPEMQNVFCDVITSALYTASNYGLFTTNTHLISCKLPCGVSDRLLLDVVGVETVPIKQIS